MDFKKRNQNSMDFIQNKFIQTIQNTNEKNIYHTLAFLQKFDIGIFFYFYIDSDSKQSNMNRFHFYHSHLSLPEKDYYLSKEFKSKRELFKKYIHDILTIFPNHFYLPQNFVDIIYNIELQIAKHSLDIEKKRDPEKNYHKLSISQFKNMFNDFITKDYFETLQIHPNKIILDNLSFYKFITKLIKKLPIDHLKLYFYYSTINNLAPFLTKKHEEIYFNFYGIHLSGQKIQKPLWQRILNIVNEYLDDALGILFVEKYFDQKSKIKMKDLIDHLKLSLSDTIQNQKWMHPQTRRKSLEKLQHLNYKIGYPKKNTLKNYKSLHLNPNCYVENITNCRIYNYNHEIRQLDRKINKDIWHMSPQTINAYYSPTLNEIVFPAAILQKPLFHKDYSDFINYGAIGTIIGHELTHGFDDQGRKYDKNGNLHNWWTSQDIKKFNHETQNIVKLYSSFKLYGLSINGELTQGENIADLGGIKLSYNSLKKKYPQYFDNPSHHYDFNKKISSFSDFSPQEIFFISFANSWKSKSTEDSVKLKIKTDPHSPPIFRVNGTLQNFEQFKKIYNVSNKNKLYLSKDKISHIWD